MAGDEDAGAPDAVPAGSVGEGPGVPLPPPLGGAVELATGDGVALGDEPDGIPLPLSDGVSGGFATSEALSSDG